MFKKGSELPGALQRQRQERSLTYPKRTLSPHSWLASLHCAGLTCPLFEQALLLTMLNNRGLPGGCQEGSINDHFIHSIETFVLCLYAAGSLFGTILASNTLSAYRILAVFGGQGFMVIASILIPIHMGVSFLYISCAILGLGEGIVLVCYLTFRASRISEDMIGRVYTVTATATQGMGAVVFFVIGVLLSIWG
ncbi:MAG: hypothetical protein OWR52_04380 [Acidibacillus sp.]|nr:hypothetical protein [Acidibacillus sp.]